MKVTDFFKSYFNGFQDASNYKKNDKKTNVLAAVKILSYFTVVIPLGLAAIYGAASLFGRISKKDLSSLDKTVLKLTVKKILPEKNTETRQPEIVSNGWGTITLKVNGVEKKFKDVIILPLDGEKGAEEWNWDLTGMRHKPGISIMDIEKFILSKISNPDVIILTEGRGHGGQLDNKGPGALEVAQETRNHNFKDQGIEIYILKTAAAIAKYNEIRSEGNKRIAALIHTTC